MAGATGGPLVEVLEDLHHVVGLGDEGDEAHFVAAFGFLGGPFTLRDRPESAMSGNSSLLSSAFSYIIGLKQLHSSFLQSQKLPYIVKLTRGNTSSV